MIAANVWLMRNQASGVISLLAVRHAVAIGELALFVSPREILIANRRIEVGDVLEITAIQRKPRRWRTAPSRSLGCSARRKLTDPCPSRRSQSPAARSDQSSARSCARPCSVPSLTSRFNELYILTVSSDVNRQNTHHAYLLAAYYIERMK